MFQVFKERLYYILVFITIFSIGTPLILYNQDNIVSKLVLFFYPIGYDKELAVSLMLKGDKLLENDDFYFQTSQKLTSSPIDLKFMKKSCYYLKKGRNLSNPSWLEKKNLWFIRKKIENKRFISIPVNPKNYWDFHINNVLKSIDYYNRAFNFSGPIFEVAEKLAQSAFASCQDSLAYLTYSEYISKTEDYIQKWLESENKIKSSLIQKQKNTIIWNYIKKNKIDGLSQKDYLFANLEIINSEFLPLKEIDGFYDRVIFFTPQNSLKRNLYFYKRGVLNLRIAETLINKKSVYKKSLLFLQASIHFQNLKTPISHKLYRFNLLRLERSLKILEILVKLDEKERLIETIKELDYIANRIEKQITSSFQKDLVSRYKTLKRKALLEIGYDV